MTALFIDASFDELKPYVYGIASLLSLAILLFAFHRPFRMGLYGYIRTHVFFLAVFGIYLLTYVISRLFFFEEAFVHMYTEDGLFENLTAVFFLVAAVFFALAYLRSRKQWNGYLKLVFLTLAILCFFVGMEEISWGQRILDIETPERMKELNYQRKPPCII